MTGIHLLRTGEVEANLPLLNEQFGFSFLDELIAQKTVEAASARDLDWSFHDAKLAGLEAQLDQAFEESSVPEERDRKAINEFLITLRLG